MYQTYKSSFIPLVKPPMTYPISNAQPSNEEDDQYTVFCRALYNYEAQDASALSFKGGDIIEVLAQESSGWWDGLLGDRRGWFPYNYVKVISDEEAEQVFSSSESSDQDSSTLSQLSGTPPPGAFKTKSPRSSQNTDEKRLKNEASSSPKRNRKSTRADELAEISQSSDFWMPKVSPEGQIFYKNSQTGQRSPDMPRDVISVISNTDHAAVKSHLSSRSETNGAYAFVSDESMGAKGNAQKGVGSNDQRHTRNVEPKVKRPPSRLGKHRLSNKVDGGIEWSRPKSPVSFPPRPSPPSANRVLVGSSRDLPSSSPSLPTPRASDNRTPAVARSLSLLPRIVAVTKSSIRSVIDSIKEAGRFEGPIIKVVSGVQSLVYAFGVPVVRLPPSVVARRASIAPPPTRSSVHIAQRKVIASVSRLVFSVRSCRNNGYPRMAMTFEQIQADARELEHDLDIFVLEVSRIDDVAESLIRPPKAKPLRGVLSPMNLANGHVGSGAAGRWKGFGWVQLDNDNISSQRILGPSVMSELREYVNNLDVQFEYFSQELNIFDHTSVPKIRQCGQELLAQISSMLAFASDIHVARHVDVEDVQQGDRDSIGPYAQTVQAARRLVRTLEAVMQAMYDDTAILLLMLQSLRSISHRNDATSRLEAISRSLNSKTSVLLDSLIDLLSLGHEQARMASGDYYGTIEWRMSRSSASVYSNTSDDEDAPDFVNMEMAFMDGPERSPHILGALSSHSRAPSRDRTGPSTEQGPPNQEQDERDWEVIPGALESPMSDDTITPVPRQTGSQKLEQILGDDYARKVAADLKPWYLRPNHNAEDILIEPDNAVKGGTLPALVEHLTDHDYVDPTFNHAFLSTFKSFMKVEKLVDLLVTRFAIEPPPSLKPDELDLWKEQKKQVVQIRVINMFITILKDNEILDREDSHLLERIRSFASSGEASRFNIAKQVLICIDRVLRNGTTLRTMPQGTPPLPIFPKTNVNLKLGDIDPLELARQLTIVEGNLYQKIKPTEALQRAREQRTESLDNITSVIQMSNRMADWVAELVLNNEDSRKRVTTLKHLIIVADRCRLNRPPISRLKRTWEQVNNRIMLQFSACEEVVDRNKTFTKYRQFMSSVTPPCVPFFGVFISTLQFIHDGNPDFLPGGLVNFRKHQMASEVITDIKHWQSQSFNFQAIPSVQSYIEDSLDRYSDTKALAERFWALSLEREPRERDDEKMARLLQETGFL
ncbi:hypothetical protein DXG01_003980 [Tephrocybe rancida]|nr:hypothetical protein DXG01_003980 [Tephrocybe rancida]